MLYAILCYDNEEVVCAWTKEQDDAAMAKLGVVQEKLARQGRLGPVARLMPTTAATTLSKGKETVVIDGPFAETKEQLLGFFIVDCESLEQAIETAKDLGQASSSNGSLRDPSAAAVPAGKRRHVNDVIDSAWMDTALRAARPRAVGALLRYFRDLDTAEEAFQEACLDALKNWPNNGPPRDPAAWLIFVGPQQRHRRRPAAGQGARRCPSDEQLSDLDDAEGTLAERLDDAHYRDDIFRLLFICCHPDLPATQQLALALRLVCGLTVQADRARLPGQRGGHGAADHAGQARRPPPPTSPSRPPAPPERAERLAAVAAAIYLMFNEGYSATGGRRPRARRPVRRGDPPGPAAAAPVPDAAVDHGPARADAAAPRAHPARLDAGREHRPARGSGPQPAGTGDDRRGPGPARQGHPPPPRRQPYQVQAAIAALHARAARAEDTDWAEIERLYAPLEQLQPSPVVTLNRAVAVSKLRGPAEALALIEPLAAARWPATSTSSASRAPCCMQLGRPDEARAAFDRAISLANTPAEAAHIRMQLDRLLNSGPPRA